VCEINLLILLNSNFRHVLNAVCFLQGNSPASKFYMPTFRNTLFHFHRQVGVNNFLNLVILHTHLPMKMEQRVPKRQHIKFRRRGINQMKAYNVLICCTEHEKNSLMLNNIVRECSQQYSHCTNKLTVRHKAAACVILLYWQVLTLVRRTLNIIFAQNFHCFRQCADWAAYWCSAKCGADN